MGNIHSPNDNRDENKQHHENNGDKIVAESLCRIASAIEEATKQRQTEFEWLKLHSAFATKQDLLNLECKIMSKISEYVDVQNGINAQFEKGIDGCVEDITSLKDTIDKLQNSAGAITPEDQKLLDEAQAKSKALADRLTALDEVTPPAPPVINSLGNPV